MKQYWFMVVLLAAIQLVILFGPYHNFFDSLTISAFALAGDATVCRFSGAELFSKMQMNVIWGVAFAAGLFGVLVLHQSFF